MESKKLRAKPLEVEAVHFTGGRANALLVVDWIREHGGTARYAFEMIELHQGRESVGYVEVGNWVTWSESAGVKNITDKQKKARYDEIS